MCSDLVQHSCCLIQIKLILFSDLQGMDKLLMMVFWHIYAYTNQLMKCYDFAFHSSNLLLRSLFQWWELMIYSSMIIFSAFFQWRIVFFCHNSEWLSVVKRRKSFASVFALERSPNKCSWGLESCITFVYHSSHTISSKYLISYVFLSMASNQAIFSHHPCHNTANFLICCLYTDNNSRLCNWKGNRMH